MAKDVALRLQHAYRSEHDPYEDSVRKLVLELCRYGLGVALIALAFMMPDRLLRAI